jgi:predicted secreted protein
MPRRRTGCSRDHQAAPARPSLLLGLRDQILRLAKRTSEPPRDARGQRIVAVIECILNQNARDGGAASFPALNERVLSMCAGHDVGIVQMPCPERECLGPRRERPPGATIRRALETPEARRRCTNLATAMADRLCDYERSGCAVLGILGGNPESPGCAVHAGPAGLSEASGVFMLELERALRQRGMDVPFRGIRDADAEQERQDVDWLERRICGGGAPAKS